jgi:hypothetical protein
MNRFAQAALIAVGMTLAAPPVGASDIVAGSLKISEPWSRATPGGAKVAAGYVTIENTGDTADRLTAADASVAGHVEIHEMAMDKGVMSMRHLPGGLEIPAGGTVVLKPGGYHLMLMDLKRPLEAGDVVSGSLTFEHAGKVPLDFQVGPIGSKTPPQAGATGETQHESMHHP